MARSRFLILSACVVSLPEATGASVCGQLPSGVARSEADVGDHQECEHASFGFEALQTASALSRPDLGAEREAREAAPAPIDEDVGWRSSVEGNPYVPAPNIYLANLVDLDNYWSYCLDIAGSPPHPQCNTMQGHSCKTEGEDTQFWYDPDTLSIVSQWFNKDCNAMYEGEKNGRVWNADLNYTKGGCLRAAGALEAGVNFAMVECRLPDALQKFTYTPSRQFNAVNTTLCIVLGEERTQADGLSTRSAELQDCDSWPAELSTWEVITSDHKKYLPTQSAGTARTGAPPGPRRS